MEHENVEGRVAKRSAMIYLPISIGAALLFWLVASFSGSYPLVARIGGTVWVLLLTTIVTMPIVTSEVKKRSARTSKS